ncbi:hypothetical protein MCB86_09025 [Pseudomonas sp. KSR10]|uniref:hypothetical protein n=1 Tax=Pseudomonas sp. KSR10 TaxID=2916654 RepID=UPI001EF7CCF3|nr:hypothetical protein [Pseudomonas sp. KSR10]MCG6540216.1 hypothetical protein [Pseudomonas sp. KSR10]
MNNIDWNEAPEWATGHGLMNGGFGIEQVWFNAEQYQYQHMRCRGGYGPYPFGDGNAAIGEIHFQQHRPAPWSGEGLPPVGTVCEAWHNGSAQGVVEVRYAGDCMVLWNVKLKHEQCSVAENYSFRPIRTPEQIAAEEREKAVDAIQDDLSLSPECRYIAKRVYEAGYRKVTP